ncbi:molybdopterin molybdotransferase MoeA [Novosphingobium mangrovi (ex Huang et al. 2023)]|uniref:Molybdopterin molybdenumtransferase n=1 Tax=Novosphingobium mangrovi (ex Huang et al. 2023) TaxID=2976432 RepID=A0ABT2I407_9SPHN|nr:molybdopterin molybdotransferase MoeA [Novosphingobium mangrovi (ex Huang et al. 2023)]MCT2399520.1 molybdopterin molybdotransferase MoeA [Novosphingobium mangrovi (ex Huang et al. 2023)]
MANVPPMPLEEAQERLLALVEPLPMQHVDIEGSIGRYLAEGLVARRTQPAADLSAMDGYAVTGDDMAGPWSVVGESAAGHPYPGEVASGQAIRISTGAVLPVGAEAVILQEDLARDDGRITLTGEPPEPKHKHIRRSGLDFVAGRELLAAGTLIGPAQAALALAAGHKHMPVCRKPRITVIDSGDELATDPETCEPHQIPASNGTMLLSMARTLPVTAERSGPIPDTLDALISAFDAAHRADVIVTSGGASVGEHDLVRPALEAWGATLDFWRVAIKPGKPILVARRERPEGTQIVIGLPGNPVSSFVTAYHFLLPVLRRLLGARHALPMSIVTRLGAPMRANGGRREFVRGSWDGQCVVPHSIQDSGALSALAASNVLIDRQAHAPQGEPGEEARVFLIENGGIA